MVYLQCTWLQLNNLQEAQHDSDKWHERVKTHFHYCMYCKSGARLQGFRNQEPDEPSSIASVPQGYCATIQCCPRYLAPLAPTPGHARRRSSTANTPKPGESVFFSHGADQSHAHGCFRRPAVPVQQPSSAVKMHLPAPVLGVANGRLFLAPSGFVSLPLIPSTAAQLQRP